MRLELALELVTVVVPRRAVVCASGFPVVGHPIAVTLAFGRFSPNPHVVDFVLIALQIVDGVFASDLIAFPAVGALRLQQVFLTDRFAH